MITLSYRFYFNDNFRNEIMLNNYECQIMGVRYTANKALINKSREEK